MDPKRTPLDVIRIANPCPVSWDSMNGDARSRFCAHCQRHVYDLTAMTQAEATDLICAGAGELCVRFARTPEGKVMTLEYAPRPRGHGRAKKWLSAAALTAFLAGCGQLLWHRRQPPPPTFLGGMVAPMRVPPTAPATALPVNPACPPPELIP